MDDAKKKKDYTNWIIAGIGIAALGVGLYSLYQRRKPRIITVKQIPYDMQVEGLPSVLAGASVEEKKYVVVPNIQMGEVTYSAYPTDIIPLAARRWGDTEVAYQ